MKRSIWNNPRDLLHQGKNIKFVDLLNLSMAENKPPSGGMRKFDWVLISDGFRIYESNKCIYFKFIENSCIIICLYVIWFFF